MSKVMLINVILEEESRVAIVENGVLDFFEIETLSKQVLKGNIYKGVVENVNAALEAAFVECGWDRPGFLPLDEVNFRVLPSLKGRKGGPRIREHLAPGMEILVQVIRDRFGTKPPSLTTYYSLPGRYLVLLPFEESSGVSRRIEDDKKRAKLKRILDSLSLPDKYGVIVRTAGLDQNKLELGRDMGYLVRLWETIERASEKVPPRTLIYRERGLALRTIRDHLTDEIDEVLIDDREVHESAVRFVRAIAPHQEPRLRLYTGDKPLFTRFNLEEQIEMIYRTRVPLKSGGEIVIEPSEAMTAVDVNSSRSREASVEELALRTNLEAAAEIARQLRLRDIGGLIVVDFIDMEAPKHARAVEKALRDAMRRDKAKHDTTRISKLGILEISRQRIKAAKASAMYATCPACNGAGTVRTTEAAGIAALRRIQTRIVRGDVAVLSASVPPDVAVYLMNQQRDEIQALEKRYGARISLVPRDGFPREKCELEVETRDRGVASAPRERESEETPAVRGGAAVVAAPAASLGSAFVAGPGAAARGAAPAEAGMEDSRRAARTAPAAPAAGGGRQGASTPARLTAAGSAPPGRPGETGADAGRRAQPGAGSGPGAEAESMAGAGAAFVDLGGGVEVAPRKRRRRRSGRSKKSRARPGGEGHAAEASRPADQEPVGQGAVIWEDEEEELTASAERGGPIGEPVTGTEQGPESPESGASPGAGQGSPPPAQAKRRRRRGSRSKKKPAAAVQAEEPREAGSIAGEAGAKPEEAGNAGASKRRRRRTAPKGESADPVRGRPSASSGRPEREGRGARGTGRGGSEGEPDTPGGWWSRMRGRGKRGDRDD